MALPFCPQYRIDSPAMPSKTPCTIRSRLLRYALASLAVVCFVLGWIGLWIPGLPTTIFWIFAAYFSSKACPVIQRWIYQRGSIGRSIELIVEHRSLTARGKRRAIAGILLGISMSLAIMLTLGSPPLWLIAILLGSAVLGTGCVFFGLRTYQSETIV